MRRDDIIDMLARIPEVDLPKVVLILSVGVSVNIDAVLRKEKEYLVVRGREAGSNDEGRGFFIPYEQIALLKIERGMRLNDFRAMYGEALIKGTSLDEQAEDAATEANQTPSPAKLTPAAAMGPNDVAKNNLLERIRAARTSASARPTGK
jgi:hypothetical protein